MPITPPALDSLDTNLVTASLATLTQLVQEDNASLDIRRGPFSDIVLYYQSLLEARRETVLNLYQSARSLLAITENPALADPDLVDDALSNYRITRQAGAQASGEVTVMVNTDVTVVIGVGTIFTANGQQFQTTQTYTAKLEAAQINSSGDRLLTATADGNWAFTIDIQAVNIGSAGMLKKGTVVVPASLPPGYVTSFAANDFFGGLDAETNEALLQQLQLGVSAPLMGGRLNMQALLRNTPEFSRVVNSSIIGMADAEMLRDKHTIFPIGMGGRVDWYVRTQLPVYQLALTKTATLVEILPDGNGLWQVSITRDDAPGFYEIDNILPAGTTQTIGTLAVQSDVRGMDVSPSASGGTVPDIASVLEAAYTRFQTAVIQFEDSLTSLSGLAVGATANYTMTAKTQPLLADLQDLVSERAMQYPGADCLIKAPVPAFLTLSFTIYKANAQGDPDTATIANALADAVNNVGFVGRLYASELTNVIYGFLLAGENISAIEMLARIRKPDGSQATLHSTEVLTVPADPANMTSDKTVQFFLDPADVIIAVVANVPSN